MALAYPIPSYGKREVLQVGSRVRSAPADINRLRKMLKPLGDEEFLQIKQNAKKLFNEELKLSKTSPTSYKGMHSEKILDEPTIIRKRPSSGSRSNNPHPSEVFLVNRLKHIPGYYEPEKANLSKESESTSLKVSKLCGTIQKYNQPPEFQRPYTAHTNMRQREKMQKLLGLTPAQGTEAWLKLCPEKDRVIIRESMRMNQARSLLQSSTLSPEQISRLRKEKLQLRTKNEVDAASKWLKDSNYKNNKSMANLTQSLLRAPPLRTVFNSSKPFPQKKFNQTKTNAYLDFQIHPQWHMPWHKQYDRRVSRYPPQIYA